MDALSSLFGFFYQCGDAFAFLPKEKILCTGDAVVNGPYNYTADGNIGNWPEVVKAAEKLDVTTILPGHGKPGGRDVLSGERQFMVELRNAVQAEVKKGKKVEDLVTMENGAPKSTSVKVPDAVKNWVGPSLAAQVRDTYLEVTSRKPAGDQPH